MIKFLQLKKQLFTLAAMSIVSGTLMAQVQSYTVDSIGYKWEDFSTYDIATELIALAGEDEVYPLVLPFSFQYFNNTYTDIFASVNGNASFGQPYQGLDFNRENLCEPVASLYNPAGEQNSANPDNFIGVYWDDLFIDPTCDGIAATTPQFVYRTIGTTPNREFIISWENFNNSRLEPCAELAVIQFVSAQLRIKETTNEIEVHIRNNTLAEFNGTIAVENIDGTYAAYAACGTGGVSHELRGYLFTPSLDAPPIDTTGGTGTGYCDAFGLDCASPDAEAITQVTLEGDNGGFTNDSGCDYYGDYSSEYISFMTIGSPYVFSVTGNSNGTVPAVASVYVDWNDDKDFDDLDELVGTGPTSVDFLGVPFTTVITPPATVTSGIKRMRVRTKTGAGPTTPCDFQAGGEVEDYSIVIGTPPPCVAYDTPVDGATNQCQTTLLTWSGDSTLIDGYYVYFGETGSDLVRVDSIGDRDIQSYLATGLAVNTSYDWRIIPFGSEGTAVFCDTSTFTTAANQDPTVQMTVDGIGVVTSIVEVCNLVDVNLSGVESQGTFTSGINNASWSGETANLDLTNVVDVVFTGDTANKFYFYTLTIADDNGCQASHSVALHTNETPAVVVTQEGDSLIATPNTPNINWYMVGNPDVWVGTGESYKPARFAADYFALATDTSTGCVSDTSNILTYDWQVGVHEVNKVNEVNMYPNPTTDNINIQSNSTAMLNVSLLDVTGRLIHTWSLEGSKMYQIALTQKSGVYLMRFEIDGKTVKQEQLIVQ